MTEQNISDFLKQLRKTSGLSAYDVADKLKEFGIDISFRTLYGYESGLSMLNADVFVALCRIYKCDNPMDLFNNPSISSDEWSLIEKYRTLDNSGKAFINSAIEHESERAEQVERLRAAPSEKRVFAYYGRIAAAGKSFEFEDIIAGMIEVDPDDDNKNADYTIGVSGDSMMPTYTDEDIVYVQKCTNINIGDIGIFQKDNGIYIKEAGESCLISHNPKYDPITNNSDIICHGKVLGKVKGDYRIIR